MSIVLTGHQLSIVVFGSMFLGAVLLALILGGVQKIAADYSDAAENIYPDPDESER